MNLLDNLEFLRITGEAALAGYWMPQLVWAALAGAVLLALRFVRLSQPIQGYQLLTALLLALPAGLLLAPLIRFEIAAPWTWLAPTGPSDTGVSVGSLLAATEAPATAAWTFIHTLGLLTFLAAACAGVQLAALVYRLVYLIRIRRMLAIPAPEDAQNRLHALRARRGFRREVALFASPEGHSPVTFGWRRPAIVVPVSLLEDDGALAMTLEHELIHVAHGDFARGVVESIIRAVFFLNPLVHWGVERTERFRELACDAELLSQPDFSRKRYALLLARFAFQPAPDQRLAVHMSSAGRLKERVQAMSAYRGGPASPKTTRRIALAGSAVFFVLGIAAMGCEVTFDQSLTLNQYALESPNPASPTPPNPTPAGEVFMIVEHMPVMIGGLERLQASIQYPDIARKAGIAGHVFIQFVVDTEGRVVDPIVVRGIGAGCDEEAVRAVSEMRFLPGQQRGVVVPVKMSIPITFKLEEPAS
ncbi:MAG: M56 family metallopeptidase [Rhodothermales bacterium]|nr:M56 family metallopeptidase [Rhodothermales bacterium]